MKAELASHVGEGERGDQARRVQPGERIQSSENSRVMDGLLGLDGNGGGQGHAQGEDAVGMEARVDGHEGLKAAQHESGAYQQDEREGGFSDHRDTAQAAENEGRRIAASTFIEGGAQVGARGVEARARGEDYAGDHGDGQGEEQDGGIEVGLFQSRHGIAAGEQGW